MSDEERKLQEISRQLIDTEFVTSTSESVVGHKILADEQVVHKDNLPLAQPIMREFRSYILCGLPDPSSPTGERIRTRYSAYFREEVEVFTAEIDPTAQILYRPSLLSKKFGWSTNRV